MYILRYARIILLTLEINVFIIVLNFIMTSEIIYFVHLPLMRINEYDNSLRYLFDGLNLCIL